MVYSMDQGRSGKLDATKNVNVMMPTQILYPVRRGILHTYKLQTPRPTETVEAEDETVYVTGIIPDTF